MFNIFLVLNKLYSDDVFHPDFHNLFFFFLSVFRLQILLPNSTAGKDRRYQDTTKGA